MLLPSGASAGVIYLHINAPPRVLDDGGGLTIDPPPSPPGSAYLRRGLVRHRHTITRRLPTFLMKGLAGVPSVPAARGLIQPAGHPGSILVPSWFHPGSILVPTWFHPGSNLVPTWFHPGSNLVPTWLHPGSNLVPSWFHPGSTWYLNASWLGGNRMWILAFSFLPNQLAFGVKVAARWVLPVSLRLSLAPPWSLGLGQDGRNNVAIPGPC